MESLTCETTVAAEPSFVFGCWMTGAGHTAMTGGSAHMDSESFVAWDGYIRGRFLSVSEPSRVEMAWRTAEFPDGAADSLVIVTFEPDPEGCRVKIAQRDIPEGQGQKYRDGWEKFYFEPMRAYFGARH